MSLPAFISKPVWSNFTSNPRLSTIPRDALFAADGFFEWLSANCNIMPEASDYLTWAREGERASSHALTLLHEAFAILLPGETPKIAEALDLTQIVVIYGETAGSKKAKRWDPFAEPQKNGTRSVSIYPHELPEDWKAALLSMVQGVPGVSARAPATRIVQRLRDKLCQLAWSAIKAGLPVNLSRLTVDAYVDDLKDRLGRRERGIRWATMRASVEELHRFARYTDCLTGEENRYLVRLLTRYSFLERGQDPFKFQALLDTGNTTLGLLETADTLAARASVEADRGRRHRLRHGAAILGIYSIVPVRNADADLVLGETLLWEGSQWVIDTVVRKTNSWHPETLVVPLMPEFGSYIDLVILGDASPCHLPLLRAEAMKARRKLFLHPDGSDPSPTYVARIFKKHCRTSFTTARTMLHTDQGARRGAKGTRDAMAVMHQTSMKTAKKYQGRAVRQVAVQRTQCSMSDLRSKFMDDALRGRLSSPKKGS